MIYMETIKMAAYDYILDKHPEINGMLYPVYGQIAKLTAEDITVTYTTDQDTPLILKAKDYIFDLLILDENKQVNDEFPPIPNIRVSKSLEEYLTGDVVYIAFLYSNLSMPIVLGKVM